MKGARTLSDDTVEGGVGTGDFEENELAQEWQNVDVATMAGTEGSGASSRESGVGAVGPYGKNVSSDTSHEVSKVDTDDMLDPHRRL
jgi:hypothetical protein